MNETVDILIVEDSPTQAAELGFLLERHGLSVAVAPDGREALAEAQRSRPGLIISDVIMPEMDGFELCRAVKQDSELRAVPVVLITTLSDPEDILRGLEAGADYYLTKPYDDAYLVSKIKAVLAQTAQGDGSESEDETEIPITGEPHTIRISRQRVLNLFLATYENVVRQNSELVRVQGDLSALNEQLESKVAERTAELRAKNEEVLALSQQLLHSARLATMGELAASIAHEVNNPLATISVRVGSLLMDAPEDAPERRELEIIENEIDRVGRLVEHLLHFSHSRGGDPSTVNVSEEIDRMLELVSCHLRNHKINLKRVESGTGMQISADRQQLQQLLLNLFTNAVDAMPEGGTLTVSVRTQDRAAAGESTALAPDGVIEPAFVRIEISDTGVGISPEILPRIMDPFFTTKPEGKGTGLGLSICRRIVKEHGGSMEITSEVSKGSAVHVILPVQRVQHVRTRLSDTRIARIADVDHDASLQGSGTSNERSLE